MKIERADQMMQTAREGRTIENARRHVSRHARGEENYMMCDGVDGRRVNVSKQSGPVLEGTIG